MIETSYNRSLTLLPFSSLAFPQKLNELHLKTLTKDQANLVFKLFLFFLAETAMSIVLPPGDRIRKLQKGWDLNEWPVWSEWQFL